MLADDIAKAREIREQLHSNPHKKVDLSGIIDHTLLHANATEEQIKRHCQEAAEHGFAAVAVNTAYTALAARELKGTNVAVCAPIGFPLGAFHTKVKVAEVLQAIEDGATEMDMVINIGALKSGKLETVENDIRAVVEISEGHAIVKVILEAYYLSDEEKVAVCRMAKEAGAAYVKTSTGMAPGSATIHDVALMRAAVGTGMGVKAAGGIKDYDTAAAMVKAGADRLGTSSSVNIVKG